MKAPWEGGKEGDTGWSFLPAPQVGQRWPGVARWPAVCDPPAQGEGGLYCGQGSEGWSQVFTVQVHQELKCFSQP